MDLPKIRELVTEEEYEALLKQIADHHLEELIGEGVALIAN